MREFKAYTILDAKGATGIDNIINVKDYRHLVIAIGTESSANLTVKAVGTLEETSPIFTDAQSVTNMYEFLEMVDLEDGSKIAGDTGIAFSGSDDFRMLEIQTNGLEWLTFRITAWAAGKCTVKLLAFRD